IPGRAALLAVREDRRPISDIAAMRLGFEIIRIAKLEIISRAESGSGWEKPPAPLRLLPLPPRLPWLWLRHPPLPSPRPLLFPPQVAHPLRPLPSDEFYDNTCLILPIAACSPATRRNDYRCSTRNPCPS